MSESSKAYPAVLGSVPTAFGTMPTTALPACEPPALGLLHDMLSGTPVDPVPRNALTHLPAPPSTTYPSTAPRSPLVDSLLSEYYGGDRVWVPGHFVPGYWMPGHWARKS